MRGPQTELPVRVLVVGQGKLAQELLGELEGVGIERVLPWSQRAQSSASPQIVVHAGSGRELAEVIAYCSRGQHVLLELSTSGALGPIDPDFPLVVCPNTNVLILKFMAMLRSQGRRFSGYPVELTESHQQSKQTEAGTARALAFSLGVPAQAIVSIRDPRVQERVWGIPKEHLARHAFHRISITDGPVTVQMETRVLGSAPYASGLAEIIDFLRGQKLERGVHDVVSLFEGEWL